METWHKVKKNQIAFIHSKPQMTNADTLNALKNKNNPILYPQAYKAYKEWILSQTLTSVLHVLIYTFQPTSDISGLECEC